MKVLLVDDDESNRLTLSVLLEDEGFDVATASSFAEAESVLGSTTLGYDLIILDHSLGDGYGTELIPLIRERIPKAKVVAMSGSAGTESLNALSDLSLSKGMHFPDLLDRLRILTAGS